MNVSACASNDDGAGSAAVRAGLATANIIASRTKVFDARAGSLPPLTRADAGWLPKAHGVVRCRRGHDAISCALLDDLPRTHDDVLFDPTFTVCGRNPLDRSKMARNRLRE